MRLEPTPKSDQVLRVSARLITQSTILHLSSDELERAVNQEQTENPALDVVENRICLFCGSPLYGQTCNVCGHFAQPAATVNETPPSYESTHDVQWNDSQFYERDYYGSGESDEEDEVDPMASIPTWQSLAEALLEELEALISPDDAPIAEQLVGNLDERGYLDMSTTEIANYLAVPLERVEYVLSQLQSLEPLGIGARNPRECLLIQLQALSEQELIGSLNRTTVPLSLEDQEIGKKGEREPFINSTLSLAYTLVDRYFEQLGRSQFHEIARELKIPEQDVRQASQYIRTTLYPYPALTYRADSNYTRIGQDSTYMRPDVLIRKGETGFEVELIEEKRYRFQINGGEASQNGYHVPEERHSEVQQYIHHHSDRAKFFIDSVHRRWRTLKRVMQLVVEYQHEFLEKGRRYQRPLTRAEVASQLNLDEGTVSRATANKYALLPNGRLMPIADFFDSSLGIKDILLELIQTEEPKHRLSDEELAKLMTARGIPMARRTVTKYREEMGIGSSRER